MALLLLGGCGGVSMEVPRDFLELDTGSGEVKATTPDEGLLWVRQFIDRDQGDLEFWAEALKLDLVDNRGYVQVGESEIENASGQVGVQMEFHLTTAGEPHGYLASVFVMDEGGTNTILLAEFVAPRPIFDEHVEAVKASMQTIEH